MVSPWQKLNEQLSSRSSVAVNQATDQCEMLIPFQTISTWASSFCLERGEGVMVKRIVETGTVLYHKIESYFASKTVMHDHSLFD